MSSVRMCDRCTTIFSENADGWATQTASIQTRNADGKLITKSAQLDKCPDCTELEMMPHQRVGETMLAAKPHYTEGEVISE